MPSNLQNVSSAHERREKLIELHGKSRMLEIKILWLMYTRKDWTNLGFDSWKGYIESPVDSGGLDLSRSWVNELVSVYQRYCHELKQPESVLMDIPARKLYVLKGKVNEKNVERVLSEARTTPLQDLILERDGIDEETCKHQLEVHRRCKLCKRWNP